MNRLKLPLDILLLVLFAALCNTDMTGVAFHEIAGCVYVVLIAAHLLLNRKWIAAAFKGKLRGRRAKIGLCVNIALFLCFWVIISTGGDISHYLFPGAEKAETYMFILHIAFSIAAAFLVLAHVLLHWSMITKKKPLPKAGLAIVLTVVMGYALFGAVQGMLKWTRDKDEKPGFEQHDKTNSEDAREAKEGERK
ncbi:hypothetical protein FACS1894191_5100 [Clostridia bacterium]|nr:hypothetical protein FACS1894191_5100 [Clostridia bacterium]